MSALVREGTPPTLVLTSSPFSKTKIRSSPSLDSAEMPKALAFFFHTVAGLPTAPRPPPARALLRLVSCSRVLPAPPPGRAASPPPLPPPLCSRAPVLERVVAPRAAEALGVGPAALPPLLLFGSADRCSTVAPQAVADAIEDDPSLRLEGSCPELFAEAIRAAVTGGGLARE